MKNPRLEVLRSALRDYLTPDSGTTVLEDLLAKLDDAGPTVPELYDFVRVNTGQGESEFGMVLSYDSASRTVSVALAPITRAGQPTRFVAGLADCTPATPEEARAYALARGGVIT